MTIGVLIIPAADRDFATELHQVEVDGTATTTKSNRPRDVLSDSIPTVAELAALLSQTSQTKFLLCSSKIRIKTSRFTQKNTAAGYQLPAAVAAKEPLTKES